jgi:hypothetical protein
VCVCVCLCSLSLSLSLSLHELPVHALQIRDKSLHDLKARVHTHSRVGRILSKFSQSSSKGGKSSQVHASARARALTLVAAPFLARLQPRLKPGHHVANRPRCSEKARGRAFKFRAQWARALPCLGLLALLDVLPDSPLSPDQCPCAYYDTPCENRVACHSERRIRARAVMIRRAR